MSYTVLRYYLDCACPVGLDNPCKLLKLVLLLREGSGSKVGIPVAEVVVVHVLVDIRRNRLGGKLRLPRYIIH